MHPYICNSMTNRIVTYSLTSSSSTPNTNMTSIEADVERPRATHPVAIVGKTRI
jgi:hypothetical protein